MTIFLSEPHDRIIIKKFRKSGPNMEDLLSFITGSLKQKGITVNEFCEQIGISRQKFYRFVKEPRRFTEDNLRAMQDVLGLKESESAAFSALFHTRQPGTGDLDLSVYNPLIADLFKRRPSEELLVNMYNIEYIDSSGSSAFQSTDTIARILSEPSCREIKPEHAHDLSGTGTGAHHEYLFTIYNCTPSEGERPDMPYIASRKSLLTIARIIKELEEVLLPSDEAGIHVRHYLSESQRKKMLIQDLEDKEATRFNLLLLNCILPLLSSVEDYKISKAAISRHYWTDHSNFCLIEHKYTATCEDTPAVCSKGAVPNKQEYTEYYILLFSDSGECSACRLGSLEVSHIFRFLSIDTRDKVGPLADAYAPENPNQHFYEMDRRAKYVMIHPDPGFDGIPKEMWMALYDIVQGSSRKDYFEGMFRKLIDPYGQYAFLGFSELAEAAMNTLEQRASLSRNNGKIVICHPEGLQNFARTGIISDLISDSEDYVGMTGSGTPLRFPAPMVRNLLLMIRANIMSRQTASVQDPEKAEGLSYYVLHPQVPYPEISYVIYKDLGVAPIYNRGHNRNRISNEFQNTAIGTLLYNYVFDTMLRNRGNELDSWVLKDEHAIALIDKLLLEVEEDKA